MDRNYTTVIKAFPILTIVGVHSGTRLSIGRILFIVEIGGALFLMYFGYGLETLYVIYLFHVSTLGIVKSPIISVFVFILDSFIFYI